MGFSRSRSTQFARVATLAFVMFSDGCTHAPAAEPAMRSEHAMQLEPAAPGWAVLGQTLRVTSSVLDEARVVNVYLPPDYATSSASYPVLYMPDGGMGEDFPHVAGSVDVSIKNAVIEPIIVVGIENTDRRRDLLGPTALAEEREIAPHAGGSERFRRFLREELQPLVSSRYRTNETSAIIGESFAGLFVVETFLLEPTSFDAYIAADPSVWWNDRALVRTAQQRLTDWTGGPTTLYLANSADLRLPDGLGLLTAALQAHAPKDVTWTHEPMPDERHSTVYPTAALHGIRWVFADQ